MIETAPPKDRLKRTGLILCFTGLLAFACSKEEPEPGFLGAPPTLAVNGLYNSGFEWVADSTTTPPKYGAYWFGAFACEEGDPRDLIEEGASFRGKRFLRIGPSDGAVVQKVVADPRWADRTRIILALRIENAAALEVVMEDGPGRTVRAVFTGETVQGRWARGPDPGAGIRIQGMNGVDGKPWAVACLEAGARFRQVHGTPPTPRLNIRLSCSGPGEARADVDEVLVEVQWPRWNSADLRRQIMEMVIETLDRWYLPPEAGGFGLMDGSTGYNKVQSFHVETGRDRVPNRYGGLHTIHNLLLLWLQFVKEEGWEEERARWVPCLERFLETLLANNFHPETHLPRALKLPEMIPMDRDAITAGSYVAFLLESCKVQEKGPLRDRCIRQARRVADRLVALQKAHDLPEDTVQNRLRYNSEKGAFEGEWPNWFGHMPNRLTPEGEIDTPRRFNTAWAITSGKPFWYHLFKSPAAVMMVHALDPRDGDREALLRSLASYHRPWDAARYDLENDTDDHYGYLCEDLLSMLEHGRGELTPVLALLQQATDHRLCRDAGSIDDTLWIQAIRLGTACAGDSPRAFQGLVGLYALPPAINPVSSGEPIYREALLELARNDLKGRQLTNAQFTESFFKNWEMVCICFRGKYQGDCRDHPPEFWHGDVGDIFGGPPTSAINAQCAAYRVATRGERQEILSALAIIHGVTEQALRREYGYVHGLDPTVARQYALLEKYVMGLSFNSSAGMGYVMAWLKLLPYLDKTAEPSPPSARWMDRRDWEKEGGTIRARLEVEGPPGGLVALPLYQGEEAPFPAPLSHRDGRMAAFPLQPGWNHAPLRLDDSGKGQIEIPLGSGKKIFVQPILLDPENAPPLALGTCLTIFP